MSYGGYTLYPYWGYLVDQDLNTAGTQIMIANSKPIKSLQFWFPSYDGGYTGNAFFAWNYYIYYTYIPVSLTPRLVTVQNQSVRYLWVKGSTSEARYADAVQRFAAGYWVAEYQDGMSCIIPNGLSDIDGALGGVFGLGVPCNFSNDPVNTSSGNATYQVVDLALEGKGTPLTFTRTYNSQDAANSGFLGRGWRCEYQASLVFPSSTEVTFMAADGRQETFVSSGGGDYTSPEGVSERLHKNQDDSFTLTHLDQSHLEFDSGGRLSSLVDRYGNETTLSYNSSGALTEVEAASGRTLSFTYTYAYLTEVEDSAGRTVSFAYDTNGNLVSVTDPNSHTSTYTYDSDHQLVSLEQPEESTDPSITNAYTDGQVTMQTDALGNETELSYDAQSQETSLTDARDHTSIDAWDTDYRLTRHTDPYDNHYDLTYTAAGFLETFTDENGNETTFDYDVLGNVISVIDAEDNEIEALYDTANGNLLWAEDAEDNRTTYTWDQTGVFLNSVTSPIGTTSFTWNADGTLDTLTDAESHTWDFDYDAYGDLVSALDPLDYETTYDYDAAGRLADIEDANSSLVQFTYDEKGNVTCLKDPLAETDPLNRHQIDVTYDDNDNVAEIEDARGNSTYFTYDDMNHLTLVEDALSGEAAFTYDENYNLASSEDPNEHLTTYAYDYNDRLTSVTDPLSEVTEYGYDAAGNLTSITYPSDDETSFTYTDDDLISVISHSGSALAYTYSYNPTNTVSQVERNDSVIWTYDYDDASRLIEETDENNQELGTLAIEREYDDVSNLTGLDIGVLVSLALTYDARNLLTTFTDPGGTSSFTHDSGGRLTEIETPEESTRSFTYDAASRVTEVENITDSGTQTLTYTHDANGNVLSEGTTTYTYDALNRLVSWYDPVADLTTEYVYDAGGNLTQVKEDTVPVETYTHNAGDQITNAGYAYDDNGNLTADGTYTYTYDEDNQLIQVDEGETTIAAMTYDHIGRRTSLTTGGETTFFHWAGGLLVAESDEEGDITAIYAYAPEGGLISMTRGEDTYYYQTNAHGDVLSLTDETGLVVNAYSYDPWGEVLAATETVSNPFRYATYYYDDCTGLYYLWHRYYDPEVRRFLSKDPVGGVIGVAQTLNRYAYASDSPTFLMDPDGLTVASNARLLWDFLWGVDDEGADRTYYLGSKELQEMLQSPGVQEMRQDFKDAGCPAQHTFHYGGKYGDEAAWDTIVKNLLPWRWGNLGSTAVQVGSWTANITNNYDGTVTYAIDNYAGRNSFFYHLPWVDDKDGGRMGTIHQRFIWTERLP